VLFFAVQDIIQTQNVAFFAKSIHPEACVDLDSRPKLAKAFPEAPEQICLRDWVPPQSSHCIDCSYCIDITPEDAMRATNTHDVHSACALLELAINAKALSVLVCTNQYRPGKEQLRSIYYGFPLVDTRILLEGIKLPASVDAPEEALMVDETENYFVFETNFEVPFPSNLQQPRGSSGGDGNDEEDNEQKGKGVCGAGGEEEDSSHGKAGVGAAGAVPNASEDKDMYELLRPHLYVSKDPFTRIKGSESLQTPDFMLVGTNVPLQKAYFLRFVHPRHPQQCVLWAGYANMNKPRITMPGWYIGMMHVFALFSSAFFSLHSRNRT
jgi:hypothetical protein